MRKLADIRLERNIEPNDINNGLESTIFTYIESGS